MIKPRKSTASSSKSEQMVLSCKPSITAKMLFPKPLWLLLVYPTVVYPIYQYWRVKSTRHILTTQRLITAAGVLFKQEDSLELYRITDCQVYRGPIYQLIDICLRLFGTNPLLIGDIYIYANDSTHAVTILEAIPNALWVKEQIRKWGFDDKFNKAVLFRD